MSEPTQVRDLLPLDVLSDEHLLVALTGASSVRDLMVSLPELADQTPAELEEAGLTPVQANKVAAAFELARRLSLKPLQPGKPLRSAEEIFQALTGILP